MQRIVCSPEDGNHLCWGCSGADPVMARTSGCRLSVRSLIAVMCKA